MSADLSSAPGEQTGLKASLEQSQLALGAAQAELKSAVAAKMDAQRTMEKMRSQSSAATDNEFQTLATVVRTQASQVQSLEIALAVEQSILYPLCAQEANERAAQAVQTVSAQRRLDRASARRANKTAQREVDRLATQLASTQAELDGEGVRVDELLVESRSLHSNVEELQKQVASDDTSMEPSEAVKIENARLQDEKKQLSTMLSDREAELSAFRGQPSSNQQTSTDASRTISAGTVRERRKSITMLLREHDSGAPGGAKPAHIALVVGGTGSSSSEDVVPAQSAPVAARCFRPIAAVVDTPPKHKQALTRESAACVIQAHCRGNSSRQDYRQEIRRRTQHDKDRRQLVTENFYTTRLPELEVSVVESLKQKKLLARNARLGNDAPRDAPYESAQSSSAADTCAADTAATPPRQGPPASTAHIALIDELSQAVHSSRAPSLRVRVALDDGPVAPTTPLRADAKASPVQTPPTVQSPPQPTGALATYQAECSVTLREGFELTTPKLGALAEGEEAVALEIRRTEFGLLRVRFQQGWASTSTRAGKALLTEKAGVSNVEARVEPAVAQPSFSGTDGVVGGLEPASRHNVVQQPVAEPPPRQPAAVEESAPRQSTAVTEAPAEPAQDEEQQVEERAGDESAHTETTETAPEEAEEGEEEGDESQWPLADRIDGAIGCNDNARVMRVLTAAQAASQEDRERVKQRLAVLSTYGEGNGVELRAVQTSGSSSETVRLRAKKKGVVREGSDLQSTRVGELTMHAEIVQLERVTTAEGQVRIRFKNGWVSLKTKNGDLLLDEMEPEPEAKRVYYKLLKKAVIRKGVEMGSEQAGVLEKGKVIKSLEHVKSEETGQMRIRCSQGWVSMKTSNGETELLVEVDASEIAAPGGRKASLRRFSLSRRMSVQDDAAMAAFQTSLVDAAAAGGERYKCISAIDLPVKSQPGVKPKKKAKTVGKIAVGAIVEVVETRMVVEKMSVSNWVRVTEPAGWCDAGAFERL